MNLPGGDLVRSRVVETPGTALEAALDCRLTGYAVLEPQETLLLVGDARGVIVFQDGVPNLAYHTGTDRGGPPALADLAARGPYRLDLVALSVPAMRALQDTPALRVPPGMPAERLAGDADLAARTRQLAPSDRTRMHEETDDATEQASAVEAFLDDEETIAAIREQARAQARDRAADWGLDDLCPDD